jgi:hypothetical protein
MGRPAIGERVNHGELRVVQAEGPRPWIEELSIVECGSVMGVLPCVGYGE